MSENPPPPAGPPSRPWYKKKRFILGGILALLIVAVVATSGGGGDDKTAGGDKTEQPKADDGVSGGLGTADAAKDVEIVSCLNDDVLQIGQPVVRITNNSSKRSDYYLTVAVETDEGKTQVDTAIGSADGLEPGQSTEADTIMMEPIPEGATCRLVEVQRTASI